MAKKIGHDNLSNLNSTLMLAIFLGQFLNTAIIVLITDADFSHAPKPFSWIPIRNSLTDLGKYWYQDLPPQLVMTMLITAMIPWATCSAKFIVKELKIWLD